MRFNIVQTLGFVAAVAAVAIPEPAPESASATAYCEWAGYTGTDFHGTRTHQSSNGTCTEITNPKLVNQLFSAIVTYGANAICLYTDKKCKSTKRLTVDTNGYRDMSSKPAYHSFKCGAC